MAASAIATVPMLVAFLVAQRFVRGLSGTDLNKKEPEPSVELSGRTAVVTGAGQGDRSCDRAVSRR